MAITLSTRDSGFETAFRQLLGAKQESAADVDASVAAIIEDVALRGDAALIDYTRRFDGVELAASGLRLTPREITEAAVAAPSETVTALRLAAKRIESFHRHQLPVDRLYRRARRAARRTLAYHNGCRALRPGRHGRGSHLGVDK